MGPLLQFQGALFQERGSKKGGSPKGTLNFILVQTAPRENEFSLLTLCRHFGTFWATVKAWARITAESRMFVW